MSHLVTPRLRPRQQQQQQRATTSILQWNSSSTTTTTTVVPTVTSTNHTIVTVVDTYHWYRNKRRNHYTCRIDNPTTANTNSSTSIVSSLLFQRWQQRIVRQFKLSVIVVAVIVVIVAVIGTFILPIVAFPIHNYNNNYFPSSSSSSSSSSRTSPIMLFRYRNPNGSSTTCCSPSNSTTFHHHHYHPILESPRRPLQLRYSFFDNDDSTVTSDDKDDDPISSTTTLWNEESDVLLLRRNDDEINMNVDDDDDNNNHHDTTKQTIVLSRPQRKALERNKKMKQQQQQTSKPNNNNNNNNNKKKSSTTIQSLPQQPQSTMLGTTTHTNHDTVNSNDMTNTGSSSSSSHSSCSKSLRRTLQQIQMTRNQYQLRQLIDGHIPYDEISTIFQSPPLGSMSNNNKNNTIITATIDTGSSSNTNIDNNIQLLTRIIVTAIHCSDYTLIQNVLLPQWKHMMKRVANMSQRTATETNHHGLYPQYAVTIVRSLLFVVIDNDNYNDGTSISSSIGSRTTTTTKPMPAKERRIRNMQYSIQEVWNIIHTELSIDTVAVGDVVNGDNDIVSDNNNNDDDRLLYRAKALIMIATWYFQQNEPLLAIQTCQLIVPIGIHLSRIENQQQQRSDSNDPDHQEQQQQQQRSNSNDSEQQQQQLSWIRLFQEASSCQSRIRQNNCTSVLQQSPLITMTATPTPQNYSSTQLSSELPSNVVYAVLSARSSFPKKYNDFDINNNNNNDRIYEVISNALVRRVVFVTGAVSMAGCPRNDDNTAEVCFIGRSNVGKSSLINMIFNRKALAYTSKRPGKTQQFNFFTVNDIPDKEKEIKYGDDIAGMTGKTKDTDSFYIVDLPGFGYAKVPDEQKQKWMKFMYEYLSTRTNLRIIFHLIDSRHGPMNDDRIIMEQISTMLQNRSSDNVRYVIVLTKADKNVKGTGGSKASNNENSSNRQRSMNSGGKVSKTIQMAVMKTMEECGINIGRTPIVLSSAETKLGRDDIWKYLQIATEKKE